MRHGESLIGNLVSAQALVRPIGSSGEGLSPQIGAELKQGAVPPCPCVRSYPTLDSNPPAIEIMLPPRMR